MKLKMESKIAAVALTLFLSLISAVAHFYVGVDLDTSSIKISVVEPDAVSLPSDATVSAPSQATATE